MSAQDKLGGYASGFSSLDASAIAANVTADYKLLDKNGVVHQKGDLPSYIGELKAFGDQMMITEVMVDGEKAWCKWQIGDVVGAGLISFGEEGVSQEQLFFFE
ncbi:hypothetical protein C9I98_17745 [Photobacterium sanctipauli]|uniref:Uncharacterized protein n=1 Tax=Photobacterium sanctipauli TaxID=1342794 RepID=A0A2T3NPS6_9GAMM|nr:hypothetical protein [Photobacterium sanctipauli]PSW18222.1 hypothetical protein C9I98_17745 [Photobacterium sanctipauli]